MAAKEKDKSVATAAAVTANPTSGNSGTTTSANSNSNVRGSSSSSSPVTSPTFTHPTHHHHQQPQPAPPLQPNSPSAIAAGAGFSSSGSGGSPLSSPTNGSSSTPTTTSTTTISNNTSNASKGHLSLSLSEFAAASTHPTVTSPSSAATTTATVPVSSKPIASSSSSVVPSSSALSTLVPKSVPAAPGVPTPAVPFVPITLNLPPAEQSRLSAEERELLLSEPSLQSQVSLILSYLADSDLHRDHLRDLIDDLCELLLASRAALLVRVRFILTQQYDKLERGMVEKTKKFFNQLRLLIKAEERNASSAPTVPVFPLSVSMGASSGPESSNLLPSSSSSSTSESKSDSSAISSNAADGSLGPSSADPPGKSPIVKLNVGGYRYETTRSSLLSRGTDHNYFTALLSGKFEETVDEYGYLFIDRDGQYFSTVLEFLRSGDLRIPPHVSAYSIKREFEYFIIKSAYLDKLVALGENEHKYKAIMIHSGGAVFTSPSNVPGLPYQQGKYYLTCDFITAVNLACGLGYKVVGSHCADRANMTVIMCRD